jgi:hypothetical protein
MDLFGDHSWPDSVTELFERPAESLAGKAAELTECHERRSPQQPSAYSQPRPRRKALQHVGHALAYLAIVFLGLDFAAEAYFISLNWVNPPVTAYMRRTQSARLWTPS